MTNPSHLCLVSKQLLPNLIPALMLRPGAVHTIVSADMKPLARRMENILSSHGIAVHHHWDAPSTNMQALQAYMEQLAETLDRAGDGGPYILNATGGTKLMALAAVSTLPQLLLGKLSRIIYTDTENQLLESLTREFPSEPLGSVIDIDTYLRAYGLNRQSARSEQAEWQQKATRLKPLSKWLAEQCPKLDGFFGALNGSVQEALGPEGKAFRPQQPLKAWGTGHSALNEIAKPEYELLKILSSDTVEFCNPEAARYLGGEWLEHYAYHTLRDLRIEDLQVMASVQVLWSESEGNRRAPNEFDVVAVHRNRMLLIECKTARFGNNNVKDQDIINRLESLSRNAAGLFGTTALLSARRLDDESRARVKNYGLKNFDSSNIAEFRDYLRQWASK